MLLKIIGVILVVVIAMTAHKPHNPSPTSGVTIVATCPNEDDLWEHVERCTVDVQPKS